MQPRFNSLIADSLASRLEQLVQRLSREHLTVGIILLVSGVFAFQISPWLGRGGSRGNSEAVAWGPRSEH